MKNLLLTLTITILILTGCKGISVKHEVVKTVSDDKYEIINNRIKKLPKNVQYSIALIKDNSVKLYGVKRVNDTIEYCNNNDKVFEIGSISKTFTCSLLANLVNSGKIKLNDNINNYLNVSLNDSIKLNFKELATHTSGLPVLPSNMGAFLMFNPNPYKLYSNKKLEEYLTTQMKRINPAGSKYVYSNLAMGTLGYTMEKITGKSYEQMLKETIFTPLEMNNSTTERKNITDILVKGVNYQGDTVSNWDLASMKAAGAILSTTRDLSRYAVAQFGNNKDFKLAHKEAYKANENLQMGLGWHILKSKSGKKVHFHNGGTGGYSSSMILDLEKKTGVVILSNYTALNPLHKNITALSFDLLETL